MNTAQRKSFMTAAECLNFTVAAEKLYISQPVISRNIAALEEEFGLLLFERHNNMLKLTPAGEIMYTWMTESKLSFNEALASAQAAARAPAGILRIGLVKTEYPPVRETRAILEFQRKYPSTDLSIRYHSAKELMNLLLDRSIDIAAMLNSDISYDARLSRLKSGGCRQVIAVSRSHPLASYSPISLRAFANDLFISVRSDYSPGMTRWIRQVCGISGFVPRIREVSSTEEQLAMVQAQKGVALVPENHISGNDPLACQLELQENVTVSFVCLWDKKNQNRSIDQYLEILNNEG
ncbi:MAG: LysR family transcriptional regulator [Oscillospiraceae bacterium]|nr:LysR family transcriptional regulator [Oscillospiraceae bacterium]